MEIIVESVKNILKWGLLLVTTAKFSVRGIDEYWLKYLVYELANQYSSADVKKSRISSKIYLKVFEIRRITNERKIVI